MIELTSAQIIAAKANDLDAVTAVIAGTEERVQQIARRAATSGGRTDEALFEELTQEGRIAVWEALSRFTGGSVGEFVTFINRTLAGALNVERKEYTGLGADREAIQIFERALSMSETRDVAEAEQLAQRDDLFGRRLLSPERAHLARMAYVGTRSLDAPVQDGVKTLADTLADIQAKRDSDEDADTFRPFTWVQASRALETNVKAPADREEREALFLILARVAMGDVRFADVRYLGNTVTVPRNARARSEVLTALRMLRAIAKLPATSPKEPVEVSTLNSVDLNVRRGEVNDTLAGMGVCEATALRAAHGIAPEMYIGLNDMVGMADLLSCTPEQARATYEAAKLHFRFAYLGEETPAVSGPTQCCTKCKVDKPLAEFYAAPTKSGYTGTCKPCKRAAALARKAAKPAEYRASKAKHQVKYYQQRAGGAV